MEFICIGKIVNTHGIKGELKIQSYSDFDEERYKKGNTVYIKVDNEYVPFCVASYRNHKGFSLVSFEGYQNINDVEKYKTYDVYFEGEKRHTLNEGEYYWDELEDLDVYDQENNHIGKVMHMESTNGAQNNLRIRKDDGKQALIPYIKTFIQEVDLEEGKIIIIPQEGLL